MVSEENRPCIGLDPDTDPCPICGAWLSDPCGAEKQPVHQIDGKKVDVEFAERTVKSVANRTILVSPEASARIIRALGEALVSPTRDDGSSKKEFRNG